MIRATTELDAVNQMLACIGEAPISSVEAATNVDASMARNTLLSTSNGIPFWSALKEAEGFDFLSRQTDAIMDGTTSFGSLCSVHGGYSAVFGAYQITVVNGGGPSCGAGSSGGAGAEADNRTGGHGGSGIGAGGAGGGYALSYSGRGGDDYGAGLPGIRGGGGGGGGLYSPPDLYGCGGDGGDGFMIIEW